MTDLVINCSAKNFGKFEKRLGARIKPMVINITREWGEYAVRALRRTTTQKKINYLRRFYRGWRSTRVNWHRMRVANLSPHQVFVERGRGKNKRMPPDKPIRKWVAFRGLPEEAVFPIRMKIAKKGIAARPVIADGEVRKRLAAHMKRLVTRHLSKAIKDSGRGI